MKKHQGNTGNTFLGIGALGIVERKRERNSHHYTEILRRLMSYLGVKGVTSAKNNSNVFYLLHNLGNTFQKKGVTKGVTLA